MKHICSRCKSENATVHYSKRIGDQVEEYNLCAACAKEMGIGSAAQLFGGDPFGSFSLFSFPSFPAEEHTASERCPVCGLTLHALRQKGKFGCSACYDTFSSRLDMTPFVGTGYQQKEPSPAGEKRAEEQKSEPKEDSAQALRRRLQKVVEEENYELAASLRDQIRKKEAK